MKFSIYWGWEDVGSSTEVVTFKTSYDFISYVANVMYKNKYCCTSTPEFSLQKLTNDIKEFIGMDFFVPGSKKYTLLLDTSSEFFEEYEFAMECSHLGCVIITNVDNMLVADVRQNPSHS